MTKANFSDWLSPEVVDLLVSRYADALPEAGRLTWEYKTLGRRTWGRYSSESRKLFVNRSKTRGLFRQQISTVLHEIRHWNQDVEAALEDGDVSRGFRRRRFDYEAETRRVGYWENAYEVDARAFAAANLDEAIRLASAAISGAVEGTLEDALEEIVEDLGDSARTTRRAVGFALAEYRLNNPANLARAIAFLRELGVEVR